MRCAKVSIAVLVVSSMACLGQDGSAALEAPRSPVPDRAISAPPAAETDPGLRPFDGVLGSYRIGATDLLVITVWKETTMSGPYLVRPDGMISVPLVGDVQASSLTPLELAGELEARLKEFIQNPKVTVQISQVHSKVVYMLGEIEKKGPIDMTPGMTLLQAISSAGGLTEYANTKRIYLLRINSGKQAKIAVHYKQALKGDSSFNLPLEPGDTIIVP